MDVKIISFFLLSSLSDYKKSYFSICDSFYICSVLWRYYMELLCVLIIIIFGIPKVIIEIWPIYLSMRLIWDSNLKMIWNHERIKVTGTIAKKHFRIISYINIYSRLSMWSLAHISISLRLIFRNDVN